MERPDGEVVASLMPRLRSELERLVRIPSIAFPGFPPEPLFEAHDQVAELLRSAGVKHVGRADSKEEYGSPFDDFPPTDPGRFQAAADDSWRPKGVTGFGARLPTDPALRVPPPGS